MATPGRLSTGGMSEAGPRGLPTIHHRLPVRGGGRTSRRGDGRGMQGGPGWGGGPGRCTSSRTAGPPPAWAPQGAFGGMAVSARPPSGPWARARSGFCTHSGATVPQCLSLTPQLHVGLKRNAWLRYSLNFLEMQCPQFSCAPQGQARGTTYHGLYSTALARPSAALPACPHGCHAHACSCPGGCSQLSHR